MPIRIAEDADLQPIARIVAATPLWQRYGLDVPKALKALTEGMNRGDVLRVADEGGVRGFCWVLESGVFGRSPYLKWIGVAPGNTSHGLGRALLRAAEEAAVRTRPELFLLCSDFNAEAQRFYRREGYQQVGALPDYVLPGVTELLFLKRLG